MASCGMVWSLFPSATARRCFVYEERSKRELRLRLSDSRSELARNWVGIVYWVLGSFGHLEDFPEIADESQARRKHNQGVCWDSSGYS